MKILYSRSPTIYRIHDPNTLDAVAARVDSIEKRNLIRKLKERWKGEIEIHMDSERLVWLEITTKAMLYTMETRNGYTKKYLLCTVQMKYAPDLVAIIKKEAKK